MGIGNDFPFRCGAKPDSTLPACLQIKVEMGILKFTSNGIRFLIAIRKLRTAAWHCRILAFLLPPSPQTPIWRKNMEQTWNAPELLPTKETTRKYCFWWLRGIFYCGSLLTNIFPCGILFIWRVLVKGLFMLEWMGPVIQVDTNWHGNTLLLAYFQVQKHAIRHTIKIDNNHSMKCFPYLSFSQ